MLPAITELGGRPDVSDDGSIVYVFDDLKVSAITSDANLLLADPALAEVRSPPEMAPNGIGATVTNRSHPRGIGAGPATGQTSAAHLCPSAAPSTTVTPTHTIIHTHIHICIHVCTSLAHAPPHPSSAPIWHTCTSTPACVAARLPGER